MKHRTFAPVLFIEGHLDAIIDVTYPLDKTIMSKRMLHYSEFTPFVWIIIYQFITFILLHCDKLGSETQCVCVCFFCPFLRLEQTQISETLKAQLRIAQLGFFLTNGSKLHRKHRPFKSLSSKKRTF